ncbi:hypothetical protein GE061_009294 [Apolygus lucorum]|uniref:receptor protein-tyrosine kinase n=1 Tax=Apolygus lucorum TaxID=248454 RepID=A0A6A4KIF9_APOLU|nr:hypothetical protein GE061_009294 [Apolygus lucorum]
MKIVVFLLLAVCAAAETLSPCMGIEDVSPKRFISYQSKNYPVVVGVTERLSHHLVSQVFKIFVEEALGYPDVKIVNLSRSATSEELAYQFFDGVIDPAQNNYKPVVDLEAWVPLGDSTLNSFYSSRVLEVGATGPPVRFGWFAPTALLQRELNRTLIVYDLFKDPLQTSIFSIPDEVLKSLNISYYIFEPEWCVGTSCATLIASYKNATDFVKDDIQYMHFYVRVVWVEDNFTDVVSRLLAIYGNPNKKSRLPKIPLIISHTLDLLALGQKDYSSVVFPVCEYYGSQETEAETWSCHYEGQRMVKLVWEELKNTSPTLHHAISKIEFTPNYYQELVDIYLKQKSPTKSQRLYDAACEWINKHKNETLLWRQPDNIELILVGIFPLTRPVFSPGGIFVAADMAVKDVNSDVDKVLGNYKLKMVFHNGKCQADVVMRTFIDAVVTQNHYANLVGILGPACSETVEPLAGVATHFDVVVISYSAEGSSFDPNKYPYFFRTIGENRQYQYVYQELFREYNWKRVATLSEEGTKYTEYVSLTQDLLGKDGVTFIVNRKFSQSSLEEPGKMREYLEEFRNKGARIIIADINEAAAKVLMCEAWHLNMTAKDGYVWFLPSWLMPFWLDDTAENLVYNVSSHSGNRLCESKLMQEAIDCHLSFSHVFFAADNETIPTKRGNKHMTVKQWQSEYESKLKLGAHKKSDYAGYAYDAVWVYAKALNALMKENQTHISSLHSPEVAEKFANYIRNTNFSGVSGRIEFRDDPSRNSTPVNIYQWHSFSVVDANGTKHGSRVQVGIYDPKGPPGKKLLLNGKLKWLKNEVPWDGTVPTTCYVDWIAKPLNTACETAWVIVNVVGIGLILLVVTVAVLIIKHRYDQKVQLTQKYMKSLGIDLLSVTAANNLDKWEIAKDRVVINRTLGQGAFGTVYGGEAYFDENGWMAVAVKTLKVGSTTEEKLDFLSEAEVMKRFDHKNIVQLLAVCTKSEPVYTIMEFMLYGDLKTFLLARRHLVNEGQHDDSDEISSKKLTNMALDIARALSYLAELKYVHRDVACRNCLVNASRVIKLGDFGMTRPMCDNDYYRFNRKGMLPVRWMAPESLMLGVFTPASDVWSFGVVLYEIITFGNFPFQGMSNNQVLEYVKVGNTLSIPAGVKANLETLIKSCWHTDAHKRPAAAEIVEFLADNARIISPCLDVPLSSVPPMEDTTFGIPFSEGKTRKFSMTLRQRTSNSPSNDIRPLWADFSEPLLLNNRPTGSDFITEDITMDHDTNFPL